MGLLVIAVPGGRIGGIGMVLVARLELPVLLGVRNVVQAGVVVAVGPEVGEGEG